MHVEDYLAPWLSLYQRKPRVSIHDFIMRVNIEEKCSISCDLTFNIVIVPEGLLGETLSKFSIWGLYITFVLAVGRFIRMQCSDLRMRIPFENLPSCDRYLCHQPIFLVTVRQFQDIMTHIRWEFRFQKFIGGLSGLSSPLCRPWAWDVAHLCST